MLAPGSATRQRCLAALAGLVAALAVTAESLHARAETDVLDIRATDLTVADWERFAPLEMTWFLVGFALGWHAGDDTASDAPGADPVLAAPRLDPDALRQAGIRRDRRLAALLILRQQTDPLPPYAVTGHDWIALAVRQRLALLQGHYAGVYGRAILELQDGASGAAALDADLGRARQLARPPLALGPSLLFARLSDWLFYTDRRDAPLARSIAAIAAQIRGG